MASNDEVRRAKIITDASQSEASINKLRAASRLLYNDLQKLERGSKEFKESTDKWREINTRLKNAEKDVKGVNTAMTTLNKTHSNFWGNVKQIAVGTVMGNAFAFLGSQIAGAVNSMIEGRKRIADEMTNIEKTTNLTKKEVRELDQELGKLNTRSSRSELRQLAYEAGKLGVEGKENVRKFVEEMNQIKVALSEDLGEDAIIQIGKMTNVYGAGALQIASAINSVGAASEASEQYLVDFAARLGGSARTARISAPDIIGFGAVLDQMGLQVEMSGTALSNFVLDFVKDTPAFEKAANMKAGSLQKIIGEKGTNEGMLAFIEALKNSTKSEAEFLNKLQEVGIDGSRGAAVFLTLSNNIELVRQQQELANAEFTKATSITDEYNKKNNNFAATLEKIGKKLRGWFADNVITNGFESLVGWIGKLIDMPLDEQLEKERKELQLLEYRINSTNTKQEDRIKLINELKSKYPDIFANINAETAGYWEITKALEQVNKKMIDRIIIAKQQAKIDEGAEDAADVKTKLLEKEAKIMELFNEAKRKYPQYDYSVLGADYMSRAKHLGKQFVDNMPMGGDKLIFNMNTELKNYDQLKVKLKKAENELNEMVNRKTELAKQLGIDLSETGTAPTKVGTNIERNANAEGVTEHSKAEKQKTKAVKENLDEQMKLRDESRRKEFEASKEALESWKLLEELYLSEKYRNGELGEIEYKEELQKIEMQHLYALKLIYEDYAENAVDVEQRLMRERIRINEEGAKKLKEVIKKGAVGGAMAGAAYGVENSKENIENKEANKKAAEDAQKDKEKQEKLTGIANNAEEANTMFNATASVYQGIIDLIAMRENAELASEKRIADARIQSFEEQKLAGLITEERYQKEKEKIEKEYAEKERKVKQEQWKRQRAQMITQAVMSTIVETTKTLANPVLAGLVAAAGALQVARLVAEPMPEFEYGGYSNITGASGKRYRAQRGSRAGGMYSQPTYIVGETNKPEFVVPNWIVSSPAAANIMGALDAAVATKNIGALGGMQNNELMGQQMAIMAELNGILKNGLMAQVDWDNVGYNRYNDTWNRADELGRF